MIISTSELSGAALDYSVQCAFLKLNGLNSESAMVDAALATVRYGHRHWSSDWSDTGHIIEEFNIDFETCIADDDIEGNESKLAYFIHPESYLVIGMHGKTHLVAACRAIVAAFIGDTVEVPDELIGGVL